MSGVVATFDKYVERRLQAWGEEFAFWREATAFGHASKNMLQLLIEHKGEMPPRATGWKPPTPIPPTVWQIEEIVADIHHDVREVAVVIRASYCGSGRVGVERFEQAKELGGPLSRRRFFVCKDLGFHRVAGALSSLARAGSC